MPQLTHEAYLDHAATTPMRPEAIEAMLPYLASAYGNPSGAHRPARVARQAIDDAREVVASVLGVGAPEVVFTSGGTESDNLAVLGVHDRRGGTVVCSAVEHHAVLDPVESRGGRTVGVMSNGIIDLDALRTVLGPEVMLVSVMLANNEVGIVQPVAEVVDVVREVAPSAVVHTDAVHAVSWLDVAELAATADLVTISAHKFGGPKGVGALVVRERAAPALGARAIGGGQERERRSGTQNVAGIVAMAEALRVTHRQRESAAAAVGRLRDRLAEGLRERVPGLVETGARVGGDGKPDRSGLVAGTCHVCIPQVESEALLFLLEDAGVYASAGSSCASGAMEPSHVLSAMGVDRALAFGSVRFSLGWASSDTDVDHALEVVPAAVARLRDLTS